jgi:hypothetical protein
MNSDLWKAAQKNNQSQKKRFSWANMYGSVSLAAASAITLHLLDFYRALRRS